MTRVTKGCTLLAIVVSVTVAGSSPSWAETVTLRLANWAPPTHHMTKTLGAWAEAVDQASGGTLTIDILKAPLAKPSGQYDLARKGIVDLAWGVPGYTPGRFPLIRAMELPFLSPSAESGSISLWKWYTKHQLDEREFSDTKLLTVWVHGPGVLHTTKPVASLAELKGLKLRVGGGGVALATHLGAVPVVLPVTQVHESLQRGTTEGTLLPWEAVKGFHLAPLVSHHLEVPGGFYTSPLFLVINQQTWEGLSGEHKEALRQVSGAWGARFIGKRWDEADTVGKQQAKAHGNTITTLPPAALESWRVATQGVVADWIEQATVASYDGAALLADLRAIIRQHAPETAGYAP